jgi:hypothetical protein
VTRHASHGTPYYCTPLMQPIIKCDTLLMIRQSSIYFDSTHSYVFVFIKCCAIHGYQQIINMQVWSSKSSKDWIQTIWLLFQLNRTNAVNEMAKRLNLHTSGLLRGLQPPEREREIKERWSGAPLWSRSQFNGGKIGICR